MRLAQEFPDLKVILTLRDPRGIFNTRLGQVHNIDASMRHTCKIYEKILNSTQIFDESQFLLARHEDLEHFRESLIFQM